MPAAIARALSRKARASATPRQVVKHESRESRMTAIHVVVSTHASRARRRRYRAEELSSCARDILSHFGCGRLW
jgi:hypothetical protein